MSDQPSIDATAVRPPEETPTVVIDSTPSAEDLQLAPGTILSGRYRIVSLLGRGGMGEVYRADDLKLGQTVALKFLSRRAIADPLRETRFYEEVRIGRQISHPNVCRLHDIAEVDGRPFLTMEFVDGEDLASLLRRIGHLPRDKALSITRDLCAGLAAAHENGVIHRDLKPGNVMIDGRGRARITDFGLAVLEEQAGDAVLAGTPAYMAPEQLSGERATVRSDLYALGLILYEVFTGRRAFDAKSITELAARQREQRFPRPQSIVQEIPAQVERAILHALEPDPEKRPASVQDLIDELPRFDPLKAAVAAGETPTPGMVAGADERGELSRFAAWSLLTVSVFALIGYAAISSRMTLRGRLPVLKSPEVLAERAKEILEATGQPLVRADSGLRFDTDDDQLNWKGAPSSIDLSAVRFFWRQSPQAMAPKNVPDHVVAPGDPPLVVPGMADVTLDATGRLVELAVVPPRYDERAAALDVDWRPLLQFAGVDPAAIVPAPSYWAGPVHADRRQAWTHGNDGTRIEAASYHGRPVWFAVVPPWRQRVSVKSGLRFVVQFTDASGVVFILLQGLYLIAAVLLAIRNLRRGQSDRRGATVLAVFVFVASLAGLLIRIHHPPEIVEESLQLAGIGILAGWLGLLIWVTYTAIEPLFRRRWPHMLISWSRLIEGRLRDPMVGRDVLAGTTTGIVGAVAWQATYLASGVPQQGISSVLADARHVGWFFLISIVIAVIGGLTAATVLVPLHLVTRSLRLSMVIYGAICAVIFAGDAGGPWWVRILYAAMIVTVSLALFVRFGLLSLTLVAVPFFVLRVVPVTLDTGAWYFGRSLFALLLIAALAVYGFVVAHGGKRLVPELALD